jgi:hypothetical protein
MSESQDPMDRFDRELREWAARPPALGPAAAGREVARRIAGGVTAARPARWLRRDWAWVAAGLVAVVGVYGLLRSTARPAPAPQLAAGVAPLPPGGGPLPEGQVLIWLDSQTPLYMSFAPPREGRAQGGDS